jgi:hypothetical protein
MSTFVSKCVSLYDEASKNYKFIITQNINYVCAYLALMHIEAMLNLLDITKC